MSVFLGTPPLPVLTGLSGEVHERFNEITAHAPQNQGIARDFLVFSGCRDSENRMRSMRFTPTIFSKLIEPLDRRLFDAIVQRHDGDAYDKSFHSCDHLRALIFAQRSDLDSLPALEAGWNANYQHHYHLGCCPLSPSALCDA